MTGEGRVSVSNGHSDIGRAEAVAEGLHDLEYPKWSATAVRDYNRWSWRGAGDDPTDPKPAMGHLGENGETDHYDEYREQARTALAAADAYDRSNGVVRCTVADLEAALAGVTWIELADGLAAAVHTRLNGER